MKKGADRDIITGLSMDVILAMERGNVEHLPRGVLKRGDLNRLRLQSNISNNSHGTLQRLLILQSSMTWSHSELRKHPMHFILRMARIEQIVKLGERGKMPKTKIGLQFVARFSRT